MFKKHGKEINSLERRLSLSSVFDEDFIKDGVPRLSSKGQKQEFTKQYKMDNIIISSSCWFSFYFLLMLLLYLLSVEPLLYNGHAPLSPAFLSASPQGLQPGLLLTSLSSPCLKDKEELDPSRPTSLRWAELTL